MKKAVKTFDENNPGRKAICSLSEPEQILLLNKLLLFTKGRYFRVSHNDLVMEAFLRVMKGTRKWDLEKSPFDNMCGIIRSVTGNEIEKNIEENKKSVPFNEALTPSNARNLPSLLGQNYSHAEEYERQECDRVFSVRINSLLKGDREALRIAKHLLKHPLDKPRNIAEALKVDRDKVYAARKRLMRMLKTLTDGWKDAL